MSETRKTRPARPASRQGPYPRSYCNFSASAAMSPRYAAVNASPPRTRVTEAASEPGIDRRPISEISPSTSSRSRSTRTTWHRSSCSACRSGMVSPFPSAARTSTRETSDPSPCRPQAGRIPRSGRGRRRRVQFHGIGGEGGERTAGERVEVAGGDHARAAGAVAVAADGVHGDRVPVADDDEARELRRPPGQRGERRLAGVDDGLPAGDRGAADRGPPDVRGQRGVDLAEPVTGEGGREVAGAGRSAARGGDAGPSGAVEDDLGDGVGEGRLAEQVGVVLVVEHHGVDVRAGEGAQALD